MTLTTAKDSEVPGLGTLAVGTRILNSTTKLLSGNMFSPILKKN